jgi:pyruvate dehydrogenase E2 component (dihydrolipoamide acetyltransferase)
LAKNVIMPALGMAQETGRLLKWLRAEGEQVRQGEMLLEVETDKVTVELEAPASGILRNVTAHPGDEVPVGTVIAKIWGDNEIEASTAPMEHEPSPSGHAVPHGQIGGVGTARTNEHISSAPQSNLSRGRVPSSPKARRLAAERGIDLSSLSASGSAAPVVAAHVSQAKTSDEQAEGGAEVGRIWRIVADRTLEAWKTIPHFYLVREVDATNLTAWRQSLCESVQGLTYSDLLVRKVAACLRSHPRLNSQWKDGAVVQNSEINIGLAVAVKQGLLVPVIRNADRLTVREIATQRAGLVDRAHGGKLTPDDLSQGTFTISNLGMYGVDFFQAIVNPPQAAILGVGRIAQRVVPIDDRPAVRQMMTLSLSCDHRLVDGARAAQFLEELAGSIERVSFPEN